MPFVIDASISAAWILPDETDPFAERCLDALERDYVTVPMIWWFEIRNLLIMAERRGRIAPKHTLIALAAVARYPIRQDHSPEETATLRLARSHGLTFYDAAYLELALRLAAPLATLDRRLKDAAVAEGLPPIG
jgi:predicted nucleic acid-binding protein